MSQDVAERIRRKYADGIDGQRAIEFGGPDVAADSESPGVLRDGAEPSESGLDEGTLPFPRGDTAIRRISPGIQRF